MFKQWNKIFKHTPFPPLPLNLPPPVQLRDSRRRPRFLPRPDGALYPDQPAGRGYGGGSGESQKLFTLF